MTRESRHDPPAGSAPAVTLDAMRGAVAETLGEPPASLGDHEDLIARGLDSLQMMLLSDGFRRAGAELRFADLIERPTLAAWSALVAARPAAPTRAPAACAVDDAEPFELAPMQQAYWTGRDEDHPLGGVNAHYYAELDGSGVDPGRLESAVRAVLARHPMLRARFLAGGRQQVLAHSPWLGLAVHDLRCEGDDTAPAALLERRERLSHRRLAVERGEVFDVQLTLLAGGATRVHVNIDMLVADALSFRTILDDLAVLYRNPCAALPPVRWSFARHLAAKATASSEALEVARAWWLARLDDLPGAPQLPLAVEPERVEASRTGRRFARLTAAERTALAVRCRAHGLTLPVVLAAAFAEVLAAWSAQPRFLLNLPLFDREQLHPDVPRVVGDFTNILVLLVDLSGDGGFADHARRLQRELAAASAHAACSGLEVLRELTRARPSEPIPAPVVFTSAVGMGDLFTDAVRACLGTPGWTSSQTPQVWLDHQVVERDGGLLVNWDVVEDLFPAGVVDAMFEAFTGLLARLTDPGTNWAAPPPPLLPARQAAVRAAVNATEVPLPGRRLHEKLFDRAAARPDAPALLWGADGCLTYGTLVERALRLGALLRDHGVEPGDAVTVELPRGPDHAVALAGVLAAGAAYVPIGAGEPAHRRERIRASARARVSVDAEAVRAAAGVTSLRAPVPVPDGSLAYVIYTSGSTGVPKGVEITHRAAANTIEDVDRRFAVDARDRILAVSAPDFDLSVYDLFGLLAAGGAAVLTGEDEARGARAWIAAIRRHRVTIWNSTPALLEMLLAADADDSRPLDLRLALVSGDWIALDLPARVRARAPACRFVALGGATEAAIWSNFYEVGDTLADWRSIPYGRPLGNQRYRVADARGRDRPDWVPGELWISGEGLAAGYRGDPEQTARRFVRRGGRRWYRTGDLGRYRPDGTLEFLGREDFQVKLRGHRIELEEVEAALEAHPGISRAVATVLPSPAPRIVAAVAAGEAAPVAAELRALAAERLPGFMVPSEVVALAELPLTRNGKVDRPRLVALLEQRAADTVGEPARGPVEQAVAAIWRDLLGTDEVPRAQSFFALGGDSLVATRLVEALRDRFAVDVSLRRLLAAPTVAELAAFIGAGDGATAVAAYEEGVI
jgi:yersiniabactin nonribosomal peptide synthetase